MYEPNLEFVRRVEVYKKSFPGLGVRVYLLVYNLSCEEAKYLAGVRKEKDSFEKIIKERGVSEFISNVVSDVLTEDLLGSRCLTLSWNIEPRDMLEMRSSRLSVLE